MAEEKEKCLYVSAMISLGTMGGVTLKSLSAEHHIDSG